MAEKKLGGPGAASSSTGVGKQAALITLVFQNSVLILIMHYSRIMPYAGPHRYFTSTAVFLNEVLKLAVSLTLAIYETSQTLAPSTPATVLFEQIYNAVFAGDGWKLAIPAALYTFQNILQYTAVSNLDAVHFQVLYQLKILITAVFSVLLLRRPLNMRRWVSLVILTLGVCIVSLPSSDAVDKSVFYHEMTDHFFPRSYHEIGQASTPDIEPEPHLERRSATYEGIDDDLPPVDPMMNYSVGVTSVLVAAAVSGLAGVYFEKILKESPFQASVWIRNVQLSFYSIIAALIGGVIWQDGSEIQEHGFFEGYNWVVWTVVVLQAFGGLIASIVIRDVGNIVKNFATSISIIVSFIISMWMFEFDVTITFLIGTSFVMLATYLYSNSDRGIHRPPPIRIASFEKPLVEKPHTPRLAPKHMPDRGRLTLDPFDVKGLGISSSRPNSPMLPRQPSRTRLVLENDD
ncbi:putative UDP-galactose transporter [Stachybotrys elegans]|uniref:UDP-galactose transporter n=1 Tax=Stachybotrys elegans TaxID=80388 RepID=A0A8K0SW14_9HYPO|nr:putative UDP-galactose transporter [Stachybotrys elegans]